MNSRIVKPRLATVLKLVVPMASIIDETALFKKGQVDKAIDGIVSYYSPGGCRPSEYYPRLNEIELKRSYKNICKVFS